MYLLIGQTSLAASSHRISTVDDNEPFSFLRLFTASLFYWILVFTASLYYWLLVYLRTRAGFGQIWMGPDGPKQTQINIFCSLIEYLMQKYWITNWRILFGLGRFVIRVSKYCLLIWFLQELTKRIEPYVRAGHWHSGLIFGEIAQ